MNKSNTESESKPSTLHPRNKHVGRYDLNTLAKSYTELKPFIFQNEFDILTIDFSNPQAVQALNKALLKYYYQIDNWEVPKNYLCPPIPGRVDYIHYVSDLLSSINNGIVPTGNKVKCLDIGVGANCIFPILGSREYDWQFVGSEAERIALTAAKKNIESNPILKNKVDLRLQRDYNKILLDIIYEDEYFDLVICNPPFHSSAEEAKNSGLRKIKNLTGKTSLTPTLNFGGQSNELWYAGGELKFVQLLINESKIYSSTCCWFTTLISKKENLAKSILQLEKAHVLEYKVIPMMQGNKVSRILAWTFLTEKEQANWAQKRWN